MHIHALLFIYNVIWIISVLKSNFSFQHNEIFAKWSTHAVRLDGFTFPIICENISKQSTIFFLPYNVIVFFIINEMKMWKNGIIYVFASLNEKRKKTIRFFFYKIGRMEIEICAKKWVKSSGMKNKYKCR